MAGITLGIACLAAGLIFLSKPIWSIIIYVALLAWYPANITVKVGTIDFTVCRIVILVIFLNVFINTNLAKRFKLILLDKLILIYFLGQLVASSVNLPLEQLLENRAGAAFDSVLPYFAVRLIMRDKSDYLKLLKCILIISVPIACLGFYQSVTGHNILGFYKQYAAWGGHGTQSMDMRMGFYRADVVFPQPIMFGLFFGMLGPLCAGLIKDKRKKIWVWLGLGFMGLGLFSSMSSGPLLAAFIAGVFICIYKCRHQWKVIIVTVVLMCAAVEIISNRHFYDVIDRFTLSGSGSYYRSRLIEVALFEGGMSGHWLTGYGVDKEPGWGPEVDGRGFTDIVNHYLLILNNFGLLGLIPFLAIGYELIKMLVNAYNSSRLDVDKWLVWCVSGTLFGISAAFMTVSLFGQSVNIFYVIIGLAACMQNMIIYENYKYAVALQQRQMQKKIIYARENKDCCRSVR